MDPNAQRIKIAEICGWKFIKIKNEFRYVAIAPDGRVFHANFGDVSFLPDYLTDLNAMHAAEEKFVQHDGCVWGQEWEEYCKHLADICFMTEPANCLARATAPQRAEAFLRTFRAYEE